MSGKPHLISVLIGLVVLCFFAAAVFAVDDKEDATFEDSYVEFTSPESLEPDTTYLFSFTVFNAEESVCDPKCEWIYKVSLIMPSTDYDVNVSELDAPDPMHGDISEGQYKIERWEAQYNINSSTISWQCFGAVTTANYGDIREGEVLDFEFIVTTDEQATDGFMWTLYDDTGEWDGGDDDTDEGRYDEDEDNGGCGC